MSKQPLRLTEHQSSSILSHDLVTEEEWRYLKELSTYTDDRGDEKHRFTLEEMRSGFRFRAASWVGVIELSKMRIQITPKFDRGFARLVEVLCFLHEIPYYDPRDTSGELGESDFVELLAQTFMNEVRTLMRIGIVKEYVTVEENLTQLRGRPDFIMNQRLNFATPTRMYCHFDELLTDVPENQVIRVALEVLVSLSLLPSTQRDVRYFLGEFEEICESFVENEWPIFQYNRLNEHYQTIHELAYSIIHHIFLKDFYQGKSQTYYSVLMDMNEIFERFSAKVLKEFLPLSDFEVSVGDRYHYAIRKNGQLYRSIEPDLVVFNREKQNHIVLDVKYKNYGSKKIKNEDIYQLAFYAHSFHQNETEDCHVHIIFPKYANEATQEEVITLLDKTPHKVVLHTKALDMEACLELLKKEETAKLNDIAVNLVKAS